MTASFEDLRHPDHRVRLAAVHRAAQTLLEVHPLWDTLRLSLEDSYPAVRHQAALALGEQAARHPEGLSRLTALAQAAPQAQGITWSQQMALVGLGRAGRLTAHCDGEAWDQARGAALALVAHEDADMRFQAIGALVRLDAQGDAVAQALRARLVDSDGEVVAEAAYLLARLEDRAALPELAQVWDRLVGGSRQRALMATASLLVLPGPPLEGAARWRQEVIAALLEEAQGVTAGLEACTWLGRLGATEATEPLQKMVRGWFTNRFLKVAAAGALAQMGHDEGEEALGRYLKARRKDMRGYAMEKVGELGLARHRPALLRALGDPRDYHADTAALALGALGQPEDVEALRRAATSGRADVRLEVARALRRLEPQGEHLARLCEDPDEEVRQVARGLSHDSDALY